MGTEYWTRRPWWKDDAGRLEGDLDRFTAYFMEHRRCSCEEERSCRHLKRALTRVFGPRLDRIYYARLYEGLRMYYDAMEGAGRR